jgi:long-chain acyl-CoA synthetase
MSEQLAYSNFLDAFEVTAATYAQRTAVVDGDLQFTFAELWDMALARAGVLTRAGVAPADRVAVVAESSAFLLATALAVWRAGAVLVTVYPSAGVSDMQYSVESADAVLLLTDGRADLSGLPVQEMGLPVASIVDFDVTTVRRAAEPTPPEIADQLALICFSSGTTSRPKAIMVSALAIYNCAQTYCDLWHLGPEDRAVVALPMAWLFGLVSTSLATLIGGGCVVVLRRSRPELLAETIDREAITVLPGVSTIFVKLAEHMAAVGGGGWLPSLRLCVSGGEPPNEAAFARFRQATGRPVFDAYCASECLPLVSYDPLQDPVPVAGAAGRLVPRAELKVLDSNGEAVPAGVVGEGFSRGPGVMLGYWRDEDQTRTALTDDGWYRTKDLVRIDDAGYVYVVGRLSDLIIRGGANISPAEIESVLRRHPAVADVAVVGVADDTYGQAVVAAVVAAPGHSPDSDELISFARAHLAAFKVPSRVVMTPVLPVSATTGKVSRKDVAAQLQH